MIPQFPRLRVTAIIFLFLSIALVLTLRSGLVSNAAQSPAMLAPSVTATKTDALAVDADGDGVADPGDTIEYTVTINNAAAAGAGNDATGIIFNDTIDPNTTLVPGSVTASPIVADDTFSVTGNVRIQVPDGASDLLGNDINPVTGTNAGVTATAESKKSAQCAALGASCTANNVTINADGSFSYNPPPGYEGADSFAYTATNANGSATGTVTLNVSGMIWFVNNAAAPCTTLAAGCGRLTDPFSSLAALNSLNNGTGNNPAANDNIFIYESAAAYTGGINLLAGQKLVGQDATATLASIAGITPASFSDALPAMNPAGNAVSIQNAGGSGVTLNSGNTVRGLTASGSTFAIDDNGSVGALIVSDVAVNSAGGGFRVDNGGTLSVTLSSLTSAGGANGVNLAGTSGGSFAVTGAVTVSNTTSDSISLVNNSATFSVGGLTQINTPASGFIGIHISGGTGAASFAGIQINGRRGKGVRISGGNRNVTTGALDIDNTNSEVSSAIEILAVSGGAISFGDTDISCNNASGAAVEVQNSAGSVSFGAGSTITGSTGTDFLVNQGSGNVTYNGSITNAGGGMITVTARTGGTIDFQGALAHSFATTAISASGNSGGTVIFSGATKTLSSATATAVNLSSNAGATFVFTNGGLDIDTTSGTGFSATGGGTVSVQAGANANTIDSTTGTALNVANTNIGASNLEFRSISVNGAAKGIVLNTTGASGGLSVTGTGTTDGSGGTIQNNSTRGAEFINTGNLSLKNMNFTNANSSVDGGGAGACDDLTLTACNSAIYLSGVTGFATLDNLNITGTMVENGITAINVANFKFDNGLIDSPGNEANESGIEAQNLSGTATVNNSEIRFAETNSFDVLNNETNLNLTISGSIFRDTQTSSPGCPATCLGEGGFQFRNFSRTPLNGSPQSGGITPTATINIINSSFLRLRTQGIQVFSADDSIVNLDVTGSTIDSQADIGTGLDLNASDTSVYNFNVINNPLIQTRGGSAVNVTAFSGGHIEGRINNNPNITVNGSGAGGSGIRVLPQETNSAAIVEVQNNVVHMGAGNNSSPIDVQARINNAALDIKFNGNTTDSDPTALADINVIAGSSAAGETNKVCTLLQDFTVTGGGAPNMLRLRVSDLDATSDPRIYLEGFVEGGAGIEDDAVATWNSPPLSNSPAATTANIAVSLTGTATGPSAPPSGSCASVDTPADFPIAAGGLALAGDNLLKPSPIKTLAALEPFGDHLTEPETKKAENGAPDEAQFVSAETAPETSFLTKVSALLGEVTGKLGEAISPTVRAQGKSEIPVNVSGETVTVGAPGGFTLPGGNKSVTIKFRATINNVAGLTQVSNQGTVSGSNFANVLTDDTAAAGSANPTVTLIDTTTVSVASSQNPSIVGQGVTLTATLTGVPAHAAGNPAGTVEFFDGATSLGVVAVAPGAVNTATATVTVSTLTAGNHTITANYSGGGQYNAATGSLTGNPQVVSNTAVWDGSADANWNNAANWTTNFAPLSGNDVSLPQAGVTFQPAISAADVTVNSLTEAAARSLTVNAGRTLTVAGACTINGTLSVAGAFSCGSLTGTGTVSFTGTAAQNVPAMSISNLTINNAAGVNLAGDVTVNGVLTLTNGNVATGANNLILGSSATVSRTSGHVIGNIRKTFNAAASFAFPVGTANGYSPATVNVTAGTFPLDFNVRAVQGPQPNLNPSNVLQRYWQISPSGGAPTANLTFNYLQTDVAGTEANYRIVRVSGGIPTTYINDPPNVVIDTTNNVATINGVTQFSDWTLGAVAPTAANVGVTGRVVTSDGKAVYRAQVTLIDSAGQQRIASTNPSGYFRFQDVQAGATYTINIRHKSYEFEPHLLTVVDEVTDLVLTGTSR